MDDSMSPASKIIKSRSVIGRSRKPYTDAEDKKIVTYLIKERRFREVAGKMLWKDMELFKVTDHTYESMRTRYRKTILPNIKKYDFPRAWISMLTGCTAEAVEPSDVELNLQDARSKSNSAKSSEGEAAADFVEEKTKKRTKQSPVKSMSDVKPDGEDEEESQSILQNATVAFKNRNAMSDRKSPVHLTNGFKKKRFLSSLSESSDEDEMDRMLLESAVGRQKMKKNQTDATSSTNKQTGIQNSKEESYKKKGTDHRDQKNTSKADKSPFLEMDSFDKDLIECGREMEEQLNKAFGINTDENSNNVVSNVRASPRKQTRTPDNEHSKSKSEGTKQQRKKNKHHDLLELVNEKDCDTALRDSQDESLSDDEKAHLQKIASDLKIHLKDLVHALYINSGSLEDAVHWIRFGCDTLGYPAWDEEEDDALLGTSEEDWNCVEQKHSSERLLVRSNFLEGLEH